MRTQAEMHHCQISGHWGHSKVTKSFQKGKKQNSFKEQRIRTASHFNISTEKHKTKEQCLQNSEKNTSNLQIAT